MNLKELKLELINQISQCNDPAILRTIANILDMDTSERQPDIYPPNEFPFIKLESPQPPLDEDAADLQGDIDEVFG